MLWFLKKIPPDKIVPRSYMDFEKKYQKDPGMNRVKGTTQSSTAKTREGGKNKDQLRWWKSWKVWGGCCAGSICSPTFSSGSSISPPSTKASCGGTFSSAGLTDSLGFLIIILHVEHWTHIRAGETNLGLFKQLFLFSAGTALLLVYTPEFSL